MKGPAYSLRRDSLLRPCTGQSQTFSGICLFLEQFFGFGLILFAATIAPAVSSGDALGYFGAAYGLLFTGEFAYGSAILIGVLVAWFLSMTLTENLYVAGGFGLYLNSRTELEGWDVELAFRRIAARVRRIQASGLSVLLALIVGGVFLAGTGGARAADPDLDPPDEVIDQVLSHDDFEIHTRTVRVQEDEGGIDASWLEGLGFLGPLFQLLFWLIVAAVIALIVWVIYQNRHYFSGGGRTRSRVDEPQVRTIMGMEIGGDTLPADIVRAAREAWQGGQHKLALSLLYRGSLSWLVETARAPIRESDTENDCLAHARDTEAARSKVGYLESLTGTWIGVAYGRTEPGEREMEHLLSSWPFRPENMQR